MNKFAVGDTVKIVSIEGMFSSFYVPTDAVGIVGTVIEVKPYDRANPLRYDVNFEKYGCSLVCSTKNIELVERNGGLK